MPITQKGITKLLKHHKLDADDSTDSDVTDAIKNSVSQDDMDEMENRKKKLEAENKELKNRAEAGDRAAEALVDQTLDKYKNRIGDNADARKFFRDGLISNREATVKALDALPEPTTAPNPNAGKKPLHNRSTAGSPEPLDESKGDPKDVVRAKKVANRARELRAQNPNLQNRTAFDQAESEIPQD